MSEMEIGDVHYIEGHPHVYFGRHGDSEHFVRAPFHRIDGSRDLEIVRRRENLLDDRIIPRNSEKHPLLIEYLKQRGLQVE